MEEIYIERKLAKTGGGIYLRIPEATAKLHDLEGGEFVKARIRIVEKDESKDNLTDRGIPKVSEEKNQEIIEKIEELRESIEEDNQ